MDSPLDYLSSGARALGQGVGAVVGLPFQFLGGMLGQGQSPQPGAWRFPERQRVAMGLIGAPSSAEEAYQRLETFRVMPMQAWSGLAEQFRKRDTERTDFYARPDIQRLAQQPGGLEQILQANPGMTPPTAMAPVDGFTARPPADDLDTAIANIATPGKVPVPVSTMERRMALPPVAPADALKDQDALDALGLRDPRAIRQRTGAGLTPDMQAQDTAAKALAEGAVKDYLDTGDPSHLRKIPGVVDGASADAAPPATPPTGRDERDAEKKRKEAALAEEQKIAGQMSNITAAREQLGQLEDLALGTRDPKTGQRHGSPLREQAFGGTGSLPDILDRGAYIAGQTMKAMSGHQGIDNIDRAKRVLRSTLAKALADQKGNLNIYEQEAIEKALAGSWDTIPSATANLSVIRSLLDAKERAVQGGRVVTTPGRTSSARASTVDDKLNAAFLAPGR